MVNSQPVDDSKYAGASRTVEILGTGNAYGWVGSIAGIFVGGAIAAVSTKEPGIWTERASRLLKHLHVKLDGKWAMIAGGSLVGSQILHYVGVIIGLRRGADKAGEGQAQFERIKARCDTLKNELAEVKAERKHHQDEFHKDSGAAVSDPTTAVNSIARDGAIMAQAPAAELSATGR